VKDDTMPVEQDVWMNIADKLLKTGFSDGFQISAEEEKVLESELLAHIKCFGTNYLVQVSEAKCTERSLDSEVRTIITKLKTDHGVVSVEQINKLSYAWACVFLLAGFRGITQGDALEVIRSEVLWFLDELGYEVDPPHEIFRIPIQKALDVHAWERLVFNDSILTDRPSPTPVFVPLTTVCKRCPLRYRTAHKV
jgi:hypothetical protein